MLQEKVKLRKLITDSFLHAYTYIVYNKNGYISTHLNPALAHDTVLKIGTISIVIGAFSAARVKTHVPANFREEKMNVISIFLVE